MKRFDRLRAAWGTQLRGGQTERVPSLGRVLIMDLDVLYFPWGSYASSGTCHPAGISAVCVCVCVCVCSTRVPRFFSSSGNPSKYQVTGVPLIIL
jgi:hypothetical protein